MSRKNVIPAFQMIEDGDMNADITSSHTDVSNLDKASIRVTWSIVGNPVGELKIQALQEKSDTSAENIDSNWFDLDLGSVMTIDNTETEHQIILNELPFVKIRLKYIKTRGNGTMNAKISAKQVGG